LKTFRHNGTRNEKRDKREKKGRTDQQIAQIHDDDDKQSGDDAIGRLPPVTTQQACIAM
jgi:hypothetical protein